VRSLLLDLFDSIRFRVRRAPSRRALEGQLLGLRRDFIDLQRKLTTTDDRFTKLVVDVTMLEMHPVLRGRDEHGKPRRHLASVTPIRQAVEQ
jgi:hypothetical protein